MATQHTTKPVALVGEICLYGTSATGAGWLARGNGTALLGSGEPVLGRSFTVALYQAAEALRETGLRGVVTVYAAGGESYALVRLAAVPTFGELSWSPASGVAVSADEIARAARR